MKIRRLNRETGSVILEFTFTLPMLLFVVGGLVDMGFTFQRHEVVMNAAREGVRIASKPGYTGFDVHARVMGYVEDSGVPITPANPTVTRTATTIPAGGTTWPATQVDVFYTHDYMLLNAFGPLLGGGFSSVTLHARMIMRNEVAGGGGL